MKKKVIIVGFSLVAILIVTAVYTFAMKPTPILVALGSPLLLSSDSDEESQSFSQFYAGLGWQGDMELTVKSAKTFSSFAEAGIDEKDTLGRPQTVSGDYYKIFLLDISLRNINAVGLGSDSNESRNEFNIGILSMKTRDDFSATNDTLKGYESWIQYFSAHPPQNEASTNYFHFQLAHGQELNFQIAFYATQDVIDNNQLILKIGSSAINKYGVMLQGGTK